MSQIFDRASSHGSVSPNRRLGTTWAVMTGMGALLVLAGTTVVSAERTPTESVKRTIDDVIDILNNEALRQPSRSGERRQRIGQVIKQPVSYEDMATRALGLPWIELTDNGRQECVDLFVQLLRDMCAGRIDDHSDAPVPYLSEQREENYDEVRTKLSGQKMDTLLGFRVADKVGHWHVYDVVIDGASIVSNYRAQFTSIIRDHSYAGVVNMMKETPLVAKAYEPTTAP
jgi:phospholipid transport system substrate-binding protein